MGGSLARGETGEVAGRAGTDLRDCIGDLEYRRPPLDGVGDLQMREKGLWEIVKILAESKNASYKEIHANKKKKCI